MSQYAYIVGASPVRLWGLSQSERLQRQLAAIGAVATEDPAALSETANVLLVRADYLFETRTLRSLAGRGAAYLRCPVDGRIAAASVPATETDTARRALEADNGQPPAGAAVYEPAGLGAFDATLRKAEAPMLVPITPERREELEARLYDGAYKGITDLVTKWLWPRPAKAAVRACAQSGITPNRVTATGFVLVVVASVLFAQGAWAWGLLCAWIMTFLDTVDGKLARVTVQSSRVGHVLDHGVDLVHPPIWYVLWGVGCRDMLPVAGYGLAELAAWIVAGYVLGRLAELAFHQLGATGLFTWRPFDAYFRLITARRNPNLIILTVGAAVGRPDAGLAGVAVWTVATTAVLMLRLGQGALARRRQGPLSSWLSDAAGARARHPHAYRWFAGNRAS